MKALLETNFGKILSTETQENKVIFEVSLNAKHDIYQGHFPFKPIVPGVCTLQLVRELLEIHLGKKLRFSSSKNVKFSGMIDPNTTPQITVEIQNLTTDSTQKIKASVFCKEQTFCKYDGEYVMQ
ncbi:3-hydroxyacyl-[acyl-carrier-protein] dehydratase [Arcicella aurantiaca]|uniref:3-hydroxyacyl-[acyl-carrier-protein] dehydratase n=1 Tax=Arcicella aurantiaca TaxID=591202 RepID=A0A316E1K0_9BACT|nr:MaoC/PaaZ C-terminal domain-containing protein [Arcicella aurantiaca]PWK23856.1 3-hydroxyacyl-[acyl-carrier-protein] dehydratase [Arcicella aurantiaca]